MTAWIDPATGIPAHTHMSFRTTLKDDDDVIEGVIEYVSLQDGPFVPSRTTITGPGDGETLIIASFHYDRSAVP